MTTPLEPLEDVEDLEDIPTSWPVVDSSDLHRDGWVVALRADRIRSPDADEEPFRRLVLEHPGAAVVLAVDEDDRVLCLRQYRHPAQHRFVELPAGLLDDEDEDPLDVARRELSRCEVGQVAPLVEQVTLCRCAARAGAGSGSRLSALKRGCPAGATGLVPDRHQALPGGIADLLQL